MKNINLLFTSVALIALFSSSALAALSAFGNLVKKGDTLEKFADSVGEPISAKFQMIFPGYYNNSFITESWAFGVAFKFSAETHSQISQAGSIDPSTMFNMGPAFTIARRFLEEDRLTVGANIHTEFRASANENISITDYFSGVKPTFDNLGGNGIGLDFDLGTRFLPHWTWLGAQYELGFAINNILGGYYKNLGRPISTWVGSPTPSYRSYNFGVSGTKKDIWILNQLLVALEFTDIGNNVNGSFFRTIHLGTEAKWKVLSARLGVNQGYLTAGLGVNVGFFDLNFATYGEEMGLNAGDLEDRRYAIEFGFQI